MSQSFNTGTAVAAKLGALPGLHVAQRAAADTARQGDRTTHPDLAMPSVLTVLLAPICFVLAIYRLIFIPLQMHSGQRRLKTAPSLVPALLACVAYAVLLGYTLWLCTRVLNGFAMHLTDVSQILRLVLYFEAFPVVYVLAESRFFYGFERGLEKARR